MINKSTYEKIKIDVSTHIIIIEKICITQTGTERVRLARYEKSGLTGTIVPVWSLVLINKTEINIIILNFIDKIHKDNVQT
jgi:hypothetical protein